MKRRFSISELAADLIRAVARLRNQRFNMSNVTQGGALTDSRLPWAIIGRPFGALISGCAGSLFIFFMISTKVNLG
jgi:hypothetical protein